MTTTTIKKVPTDDFGPIAITGHDAPGVHLFFVATGGMGWGRGPTLGHAIRSLKKECGRDWAQARKDGVTVQVFASALPFVPVEDNRKAGADEADAWCNSYGVAWIRCHRVFKHTMRGF